MREIVLVFEGHEDSEKKAADTIQTAIFNALEQERMSIMQFTNQMVSVKKKVAIGTPEQIEKLQVPDWIHNYGRQSLEGKQPSK